MSRNHTVRITSKGVGAAEVCIDGVDIARSLKSLDLHMGRGEIPTMTADLLLHDVTELQDTEARVIVPDATADTLKLLGWTPPDGEHPTAP